MALRSGCKRNNERARPPRRKSPATTRHDWERVDKLSRNREHRGRPRFETSSSGLALSALPSRFPRIRSDPFCWCLGSLVSFDGYPALRYRDGWGWRLSSGLDASRVDFDRSICGNDG